MSAVTVAPTSLVQCAQWFNGDLCGLVDCTHTQVCRTADRRVPPSCCRYSSLYGLFANAYVSTFPTCHVELFGPADFAVVNGSLYMARGLATLVGTPAAGALIRSSVSQAMSEACWRPTLLVGSLLAGTSVVVFWAILGAKRDRKVYMRGREAAC
jgi:hypothetical protein